jgi:methylenetetrahydrofolate dehydrogenase (NADP+) / methenyltetrahydrofolate cyclohydrolase
MIVDGRAIANLIYQEIRNEISHRKVKPHMTVFTCQPNFETQKYLSLKRRKAHEVGIGMSIIEFPTSITTEEVVTSIQHAPMQTDGIIVQLPFPPHIDIDAVLRAIPKSCDIDRVIYDGEGEEVLPPVIGAIREVARQCEVVFSGQKVVVVGHGKLVGAPARVWCEKQGAEVTVVTEETANGAELIKSAKILILGVGKPGMIKPDMINENVILFDAGTSEDGGVLRGDADPECAKKALLFTPVPGGIGPITVAILFRNLLTLASY